MSNPLEYPKLRWPIDLRIERVEQHEVLLVTCPIGISPQPLGLIAAVAPIVAQFEGKLSIDELTAKFSPYGVQRKLIEDLAGMLDAGLFLESPRFFEAQTRIKHEFETSTVRSPALAGLSYAHDPDVLAQEIDG